MKQESKTLHYRVTPPPAGSLPGLRFLLAALLLWVGLFLLSAPVRASMYAAELPEELVKGEDLCAYAPCRDVMPGAAEFSRRKGSPAYVEAYAKDGAEKRLLGYVFLSTDVVDIPAYSGKPVVTLIGMDTHGIIAGVRVLKHSEPILLAGIPESELVKFIQQYIGKAASAKLEIGRGQGSDGAVELDAISGATVTAIAENQVISRSAYEIARQVGIIKSKPRPPARFAQVKPQPDWKALAREGSVQHLLVPASEVGAGESSRPYLELYFGYLNVPSIGSALLGEQNYQRLMQDLKPNEHAIFIVGDGQASFKGSGFVRGGIYDRVQVRQDPVTFTFRDTDYLNLYGLKPADAPDFKESGIFIIRSENFNPAYPWQLVVLANKVERDSGRKSFAHFEQEFWLPARYLEGGRPHVARAQAAWRLAWESSWLKVLGFVVILGVAALMYARRDWLVRRSRRKHKPWISRPRHLLWIASVAYLGFYLKAQPSVTQIMTFVHSLLHGWKWDLFLSDPFIFLFWCFIAVTVLVWGRGLFCGWLCPFGSLQHLAHSLGKLLGLGKFQRILPKTLHDKLRLAKYLVFFVLLGVSLVSMEMAEKMAEIEPFKTTFLVGVWNRSWPFWVFIGGILGISILSERPYCKYICPLGAGLALPGKFRLFGLKRKAECTSCHACASGCGSNAIDDKGRIDPMECLLCLDCMVMYYDDHACPPLAKERKSRERAGQPLTPIDGRGYFIALEVVRKELADKSAEMDAERQAPA